MFRLQNVLNSFYIYTQVHLKKNWISRKKVNIFCHSFQKVKPTYYIDSLHIEIFQAIISWTFDDYGLQIMKTQNSVFQKIRILHKINKKGYFKQKCQASEKYVHFYALNTRLGLLLHELLHQCGVAWKPVALLRSNEAQVAFIAAFMSSALLGLMSLILFLTIPHRFSMRFRSGEFAGWSSTVTSWSLNQRLVPLAVWAGAKSCLKMKSASP